jgi:hypothetical protein
LISPPIVAGFFMHGAVGYFPLTTKPPTGDNQWLTEQTKP